MNGELSEISWPALGAATVVAFVLSSVYYTLFGARMAQLSGAESVGQTPPPWKLAVEVLRSLTVATVVAGLAAVGAVEGWGEAALLALALWFAFPLVLLSGSVIWEDVPPQLAALHAGDWLAKLIVIAIIVS